MRDRFLCGLLLTATSLTPPLGTMSVAVAAGTEQSEATPGTSDEREVVVADQTEFTGKVIAIDRETRSLVIEGSDGLRLEIDAPEAATNFDSIALGDEVRARFYESVVLSLRPASADAEPRASKGSVVVLAPAGGTPGGAIANTRRVEAVVRAVDPEARTVTLNAPRGVLTLKVRPSVDLANVKVGEQVVAMRTEALAIAITRPERTPPVASPPAE